MDDYYKHVSKKANQNDHRGFLASRKAWVRQHNEGGPTRKRLQSKKELQEALKQMQMTRSTGGKFIAPKKQFITQEAWDSQQYGDYDSTKEVIEHLWGRDVKGIWIHAGKKGVYDYEEYQDSALQESELVHDSRTGLDEGLARKRKAALEQINQGSLQRDKMAVESKGSELSLEGVLDALRQGGYQPSSPKSNLAGAHQAAVEDCQDDSSSEGTKSSSGSEKNGLCASFFGPSKPKQHQAPANPDAKKKPGRRGEQQASNPATASSKPSTSRPSTAATGQDPPKQQPGPRGRDAKGKASSSSTGFGKQGSQDSGNTLLADGRAQRALRNLQDKVVELKSKLAKVKVDDAVPEPDAHSQATFKQSCADRIAEVKSIGRQAREHSKRMDKSSNRDLFDNELKDLDSLEAAALALQNLFTAASSSTSSPEFVLTSVEESSKHLELLGVESLGTCYTLRLALAKAAQNCLYSEYDKFYEQFLLSKPSMKSLQDAIGSEQLAEFVLAEIESRILLNLRAVKALDVEALSAGKENVDSVLEVVAICKALVSACKEHTNDFIGNSLRESCELALGLVSEEDISATQQAVEALAEMDGEKEGLGGIEQFLLNHAVGQSLVALATSRVDSGENEAKATESLKKLEASLGSLQAVSHGGASVGIKLITADLQPTQELIVECSKQLSVLKARKATKEPLANAKQTCRAHDRLRDVLKEHMSGFATQTQRLLREELKINLTVHLHLVCTVFLLGSAFMLDWPLAALDWPLAALE